MHTKWFYYILVVYAVLVIALGASRLAMVPADPDGSQWPAVPVVIIMVAATIGPAWIAEMVFTKYREALPAAKRLRLKRKQVAEAKATISIATTNRIQAENRGEAWRRKYEQLEAIYIREYRNAGGKLPEPQRDALPTAYPRLEAPKVAQTIPVRVEDDHENTA